MEDLPGSVQILSALLAIYFVRMLWVISSVDRFNKWMAKRAEYHAMVQKSDSRRYWK